jgi:diguanylate cyclase (GGDEF)-like protein
MRDPATLRMRYPEWLRISHRINLLVDDLLVQGANLATTDLNDMADAMRAARLKLLGALILVGGFILLLIALLRQHLIRPLQRIDHALSSLDVGRPAPEFPDSRLAEIHAVEDATGRLHKAMVSNEAARRELELLANRDGLTGLINRRHFMVNAEAEIRRAQRYERPIVVALGDLDYFKRLNDTYGHGAGDVVLRTFAGLLSESVRQSDLVCRYGGEEFAFLFPESTVEQAHILVERFRQRFAEHDIQLPSGLLVRVTISIGLADASHCPLDIALQRADYALYEAKRLGRNRVIVAAEAD